MPYSRVPVLAHSRRHTTRKAASRRAGHTRVSQRSRPLCSQPHHASSSSARRGGALRAPGGEGLLEAAEAPAGRGQQVVEVGLGRHVCPGVARLRLPPPTRGRASGARACAPSRRAPRRGPLPPLRAAPGRHRAQPPPVGRDPQDELCEVQRQRAGAAGARRRGRTAWLGRDPAAAVRRRREQRPWRLAIEIGEHLRAAGAAIASSGLGPMDAMARVPRPGSQPALQRQADGVARVVELNAALPCEAQRGSEARSVSAVARARSTGARRSRLIASRTSSISSGSSPRSSATAARSRSSSSRRSARARRSTAAGARRSHGRGGPGATAAGACARPAAGGRRAGQRRGPGRKRRVHRRREGRDPVATVGAERVG